MGRYHDDELKDIWEREDMDVKEVEVHQSPLPEWIGTALQPGGGGSGSSSSYSMMNVQTLDQLKKDPKRDTLGRRMTRRWNCAFGFLRRQNPKISRSTFE